MDKESAIIYWVESAAGDEEAMDTLLGNGHYSWALFIGHLVIEKLLKAYYIKNKDLNFPHIHQLLRIAEEAGLTLSDEQKDFLLEITTFNIKARYADYKSRFHKKATREFTEAYIIKIREFREWLQMKIKE
jgi:HEPN domain-containing protein